MEAEATRTAIDREGGGGVEGRQAMYIGRDEKLYCLSLTAGTGDIRLLVSVYVFITCCGVLHVYTTN